MSLFKKSKVTLNQFVRGVVKALTDGQQAIPHARDEVLRHHMDIDDKDIMRPKVHTIEIEPGQVMNMPTYTFSQVNTIGIKGAKIQCSARIVGMESETTEGKCTVGDSHALFNVSPSNGGKDSFSMVIEFEQREPSETEMHLIEALDRSAVVESETDGDRDPGRGKT